MAQILHSENWLNRDNLLKHLRIEGVGVCVCVCVCVCVYMCMCVCTVYVGFMHVGVEKRREQ